MADVLTVQRREPKGKRHARRMRAEGVIPANLYGHGEANVFLCVPADQVRLMLRHGARVVDLQGEIKEKAFIRELQWDTYGTSVLHMDLTRVSADERLTVQVAVEMKGQAVGLGEGGVVELLVHEVEIECLALEIPEKLFVRVGDLHLGGHLSASAIDLPPGAKLMSDPDEMIVHCIKPHEAGPGTEMGGEGAEPEVIGRKAEEEGEEE